MPRAPALGISPRPAHCEQTGGSSDTQWQPPGQAAASVQPQPWQMRSPGCGRAATSSIGSQNIASSAFGKSSAELKPARIRERVEIERPESGAFLAVFPAGRVGRGLALQADGEGLHVFAANDGAGCGFDTASPVGGSRRRSLLSYPRVN